jgi:predicted lipoprotein with Yx(FWY)xxD motif
LLLAVAAVAVVAMTAIAIAKTFTVKVAKNVNVTDLATHVSRREPILVNARGVALYTLSGETAHHLKCTSTMCITFWPPDKVRSAHVKLTKPPGVKGKLGIIHRHGFFQLTLNGRPLYTFKLDAGKRGIAMGEGVVAFGGTWHVIKGGSGQAGSPGQTPTTTTTTTTSTSTSSSYTYTY